DPVRRRRDREARPQRPGQACLVRYLTQQNDPGLSDLTTAIGLHAQALIPTTTLGHQKGAPSSCVNTYSTHALSQVNGHLSLWESIRDIAALNNRGRSATLNLKASTTTSPPRPENSAAPNSITARSPKNGPRSGDTPSTPPEPQPSC